MHDCFSHVQFKQADDENETTKVYTCKLTLSSSWLEFEVNSALLQRAATIQSIITKLHF